MKIDLIDLTPAIHTGCNTDSTKNRYHWGDCQLALTTAGLILMAVGWLPLREQQEWLTRAGMRRIGW